MTVHGVILFHNTTAAFRAEKVLREAGLECRLVPVPREFSSDCGVSARFEWARAGEAARVLEAGGVEIAGIHPLPEDC